MMNNLFWICFGIALTVFWPELTDYAHNVMSGALEILMSNKSEV